MLNRLQPQKVGWEIKKEVSSIVHVAPTQQKGKKTKPKNSISDLATSIKDIEKSLPQPGIFLIPFKSKKEEIVTKKVPSQIEDNGKIDINSLLVAQVSNEDKSSLKGTSLYSSISSLNINQPVQIYFSDVSILSLR